MKYRDRWLDQHYRRLADGGTHLLYCGKPFEEFATASFLDVVLRLDVIRKMLDRGHPSALEYGTGTGPGACHLAARGFRVDAIDVCPAAIEIARRIARERDLPVRFEVQDVVSVATPADAYDLVLDTDCLHQITDDGDRRRALGGIRTIVKRNGLYVVATVVYHEGRDFGPDRFDTATATKWARIEESEATFDPGDFDDVARIDGHWYWRRSRHRRPDEVFSELTAAGFRVVYQSSFGGLLLCVREDSELPVDDVARALRASYRDDPVAESIRLKYPIAGSSRVS